MGAIEVRQVHGRSDLAAWVSFPRREVYPPSSPWVPPLDGDLRRTLDPKRNPFFRHGEAAPLLAIDDRGRVAGRVLAHLYHRHNARHDERAAFFGYFECINDPAAARALVGAAASFGA